MEPNAGTSRAWSRILRSSIVLVFVLALVAVAVAAHATRSDGGDTSRPRTGGSPIPTCDYANSSWMQQPGCDRPPSR